MKDSKFLGLKRRQFYKIVKKEFYTKDNITVCKLKVFVPMRNNNVLSLVEGDRVFRDKFTKAYPDVHIYYCYPKEGPGFIFSVKAKATCLPGDIYDERIGHNIADAKAEMKALNIMAKIITFGIERAKYITEKALLTREFLVSCYERERNFVDNI